MKDFVGGYAEPEYPGARQRIMRGNQRTRRGVEMAWDNVLHFHCESQEGQ